MTRATTTQVMVRGVAALVMLGWGVVVLAMAIYAVFVGGDAWAPVFVLGAPWLLIVGLTGKVARR